MGTRGFFSVANFHHLMTKTNNGLQLVQRNFFRAGKRRKSAIFWKKNKLKLTIFEHWFLYVAKLEEILLLSLTYSQIWLSPLLDDHSGTPKKIPNGNTETVCGTVPLTKIVLKRMFWRDKEPYFKDWRHCI
jgi:hypothetical protein